MVRRALNQYLIFARQQKVAKRGRLLKLLDQHPVRPKLIAWLRLAGELVWTAYLDRIEPSGGLRQKREWPPIGGRDD